MLAAANQQTKQSKEVCRMPWFLVQIQNSQNFTDAQWQKNGKYFIIHSVDINDCESSNMYVDGIVKFGHNQNVLEGRVLLAAEERAIIEEEMRILTHAAENNSLSNGKFLLLQYSSAFNNVIYAMLNEKDIVWPTVLQATDTREVIVNDEQQQQRIASVLSMDGEQKLIEMKFQELKNHTMKMTLENKSTSARADCDANDDEQWMLVQYSKSPFNVVYAILNQRENIWYEQNLYKSVVAYFKQGSNVFQAVILQRSADIKELLKKMSLMKENCQQLFITKENKENFEDVDGCGVGAVVAPNTGAVANVSHYLPMVNRITFYGSNLNFNSMG